MFLSICQENWRWTLEMSQEMEHDLGVFPFKWANLNKRDFLNVRKAHIEQKEKCLENQLILSKLLLSITCSMFCLRQHCKQKAYGLCW